MNQLPFPQSRPSPFRSGFSLVETSVAMGLFAILIMPVLGLISAGMSHSSTALDLGSLQNVRDSLRLRLTEQPDWPFHSAAPQWETTIHFSRSGEFLPADESSKAFVKIKMTASPTTSQPDLPLEAIRCQFINPRTENTITSTVIQRSRQP